MYIDRAEYYLSRDKRRKLLQSGMRNLGELWTHSFLIAVMVLLVYTYVKSYCIML